MNELYGLDDIPDTTFSIAHHTDPVFRNAVDKSVRIDPETIARLTARIYKGDLDADQDLDRDFYQAVASVMHEAVEKGLKGSDAPTPDDYFHHQLTHSADVFAAFKVHRAQSDIAAQLIGEDGNLRPFREFQERVLPITSHQCGRWLRTEYNTAVIRAQRAAEWQQFLDEADVLPNLEWMPSTSANPGEDHQVFWGTILPVTDPFWNEHRPGDRWNCKCSLQATDAKPTARPRGFSEIANAPQPGLDTNPGTDGAVFSPSHPYFPTSCSQCPFKATVPEDYSSGFTNATKDCMHCEYVRRHLPSYYDKSLTPPHIEEYSVTELGSNKIFTSPMHGANELEENIRLAKFIANKLGVDIHLLPRIATEKTSLRNEYLPQGVPEGKNPDFLIGGVLYEGKSMLNIEPKAEQQKYINGICHRLNEGKKQAGNVIIEIVDFIPRRTIHKAITSYLSQRKSTVVVMAIWKNKLLIYSNENAPS